MGGQGWSWGLRVPESSWITHGRDGPSRACMRSLLRKPQSLWTHEVFQI